MDCLSEQEAADLVALGDLDAHAPGLSEHMDGCADCRRLISALAAARDPNDARARQLVAGLRVGRYVLRRPLGEGGMAVVWEADDLHLGRRVALKWLHAALSADAAVEKGRILREARAGARLNHPNVVTLFDTGEHEGESSFIAMELAPGGTLSAWLREASRAPVEIVNAFVQAGRGLAAAHRAGIVHGDFKPDNVLRSTEGAFKVTDFGLASGVFEGGRSVSFASGRVAGSYGPRGGTLFFMAPERLAGGPSTPLADQYSFGIALKEALGGSLAPRDREVRAAALRAVARATSPAPEARFATMDELLSALEASIAAPPTSRSLREVVAAATKRRPLWLLLLTPVVMLMLVLAIVDGGSIHRPPTVVAAASQTTPQAVQPVRFADLLPPRTDNPAALVAYGRALSDLYDATEPLQNKLREAIRLDPTFAAAHLREAFVVDRPASTAEYREAVRFRDRLDERDRTLLAAEEPCDVPEVPDYTECKRRFDVLQSERPYDLEILFRLAHIEMRMAPGSQLATYERMARLDPKMALAELGIGRALESLGRGDEAKAHFKRCQELSPVAAMCILNEAKIAARGGDCNVLADAVSRAGVIVPGDVFLSLDALNTTLTTGAPRTAADTQVDRVLLLLGKEERASLLPFRGIVALWFGDFPEAYEDLETSTRALQSTDGTTIWGSYEQLVAAEEMADATKVKAYLRTYMAERVVTKAPGPWDHLALRAIRAHHVLSEAQVATLKETWRANTSDGGVPAWDLWLRFDAAVALTQEEARAALSMPASKQPPRQLRPRDGDDEEYEVGRVLALAGRPADAAPNLEAVARSCVPFTGYRSSTRAPFILRASYDLGEAREAMGDRVGACESYRRVLERWGHAKPRSVTADEARAHAKALGCAT
jgi:serine/threonine-protein kinase